jgi:hypothetical protein
MKRRALSFSAFVPWTCVWSTLAGALVVRPATASPPCEAIARQTSETVIAYEPPSAFTICRQGRVETDVVEGRPVYVELVPGPAVALLRFRVHGRATHVEPSGLREVADRMAALAAGLRALGGSAQPRGRPW